MKPTNKSQDSEYEQIVEFELVSPPDSSCKSCKNAKLSEDGGLMKSEFPPTRVNSLRVRQQPQDFPGADKPKSDPIWEKVYRAFDDTKTARPLSKEKITNRIGLSCTELVNKLSDTKLENLYNLGIVESVVMAQAAFAATFIVASIALSVTGSFLSPALFFSGILIAIQLSPTASLLLLESVHAPFTFRLSSHVCAFSNGLLAIASWMLEAGHATRALLLLFIAALQYGSLCILKLSDYVEKYQCGQKKHCKKKANGINGGVNKLIGNEKANMEKLQEIEYFAKGRSPPPERPEDDKLKLVR